MIISKKNVIQKTASRVRNKKKILNRENFGYLNHEPTTAKNIFHFQYALH